MMRKAFKVELYDADVVLVSDSERGFEHTGWDYSDSHTRYALTSPALEILKTAKLIDESLYEHLNDLIDVYVVEKTFSRRIFCEEIWVEEREGSLDIQADAYNIHAVNKPKEAWHVSSVYRGNYSIFWEIE